MEITRYSYQRIQQTFINWGVEDEWFDVMYRYLVQGLPPGGFFTSLLANDAVGMLSRSHPGNNIPALKALCGCLVNCFPEEAWGSYDAVEKWLEMTSEQRRTVLEKCKLLYTEKEEVMLALSDKNTTNFG